jgi:hypothetical protein
MKAGLGTEPAAGFAEMTIGSVVRYPQDPGRLLHATALR